MGNSRNSAHNPVSNFASFFFFSFFFFGGGGGQNRLLIFKNILCKQVCFYFLSFPKLLGDAVFNSVDLRRVTDVAKVLGLPATVSENVLHFTKL